MSPTTLPLQNVTLVSPTKRSCHHNLFKIIQKISAEAQPAVALALAHRADGKVSAHECT